MSKPINGKGDELLANCQVKKMQKIIETLEISARVSGENFSATPTLILAVFKVEAMEVMSFYKVAKSFRLKRGETRITDLTV